MSLPMNQFFYSTTAPTVVFYSQQDKDKEEGDGGGEVRDAIIIHCLNLP